MIRPQGINGPPGSRFHRDLDFPGTCKGLCYLRGVTWPLQKRLPARPDQILDHFLDYAQEKKLVLYGAQEEAILELLDGKNVILNTPTGSGKSLVALALHYDSIARGRRSYYTSPIKALVNEKFFALCRELGPENVGMITGDASVNPGAPVICCTAEILMIDALRDGARANIQDVVMDEFHYYSDRERGVAWQVPLLALPQARFLLMSATLGDTEPFEKALTELNELPTTVVRSAVRPVPLDFKWSEDPLHEAVSKLIRAGRAPIYLVSFTQRECAEEAQNFTSVELCTKEEKKAIADELAGVKFTSPYGKEFQRFLRHGMGIHHAGLLPRYRILVEKLAQKGLLKIIFGTDTLGVGVNVPIRTVLLTKLCKFDGEKTQILSVRDFQQICGRAGRKGFDDLGTVIVQAPEHVIENLANERKAAGDPKKLKKLVKRKPPEKGYVPWTEETFRKLVDGKPEALVSRFKVTHAMLLHVLSRPPGEYGEDGCRAMRDLIFDSHESDASKRKIGRHAFQLFRSLVDRKIIEFNPLRVNVDLQEDFSLNHALSLYLVDTIKLLDPKHPDYAYDVLTLVESILENPDAVLRKQLDRIKSEKMQELKAQGMEFDERIEELEKLEYPKPNREFIYDSFNAFAAAHPWIGQENIRPKSIAREMVENLHSFGDYVREYELQRSEGVLLRYLSEAYKTLIQNVPGYDQSDELYDIAVSLGGMIREIDSSLIDEWERMRNPEAVAETVAETVSESEAEAVRDVTRNRREFKILVRNAVFRLVRELSAGRFESVRESVEAEGRPELAELDHASSAYAAGHSRLLTDTKARGAAFFRLNEEQGAWSVQQILVDADGHNDWALSVTVDLAASAREGRPVLRWKGIAAL